MRSSGKERDQQVTIPALKMVEVEKIHGTSLQGFVEKNNPRKNGGRKRATEMLVAGFFLVTIPVKKRG